MSLLKSLVVASLLCAAGAQAQSQSLTAGTLVILPASGEVTHINDQVTLSLGIEEQDRDKNAAAARVNAKMKLGMDIVRKADPSAHLQTQTYYTTAIYPEDNPARPLANNTKRVPIAWRVSQVLEVRTTNLAGLPKTAGAAQQVLQINRVRFGLSPALTRQFDDERIAATYRNLNERVASIARAMGKKPSDAMMDTVDFEGSGRYADDARAMSPQRVEVTGSRNSAEDTTEPSFEPGESTLQMRLVGKVRFH